MGDRFDGGLDSGAQPGQDAATLREAGTQADATMCSTPFDAATQTCNPPGPRYRCIRARWIDTPVRCGDTARLEAVIIGYPADSAATVEVMHPSNGSVIETIQANMQGGRIDTSWRVMAQTANWRTDRISFRISVPSIGVTCVSGNSLAFRNRPTTGWERMNQEIPGIRSNAHRIYDQALEASRVHISVKIKLTGMALQPAERLTVKRSIESVWNDGFSQQFTFHRARGHHGNNCGHTMDCCRVGFHLDVNFVEQGQHITVEMRDGTLYDRASHMNELRHENTSRTGSDPSILGRGRSLVRGELAGTVWYYPPWTAPSTGQITRANMHSGSGLYAHEIGHILGNFDEYPGGGNDPQGYQPADSTSPAATQNLMSSLGVTRMFPRFYRYFLWFLNQHTDGDRYVILDTHSNATYSFP